MTSQQHQRVFRVANLEKADTDTLSARPYKNRISIVMSRFGPVSNPPGLQDDIIDPTNTAQIDLFYIPPNCKGICDSKKDTMPAEPPYPAGSEVAKRISEVEWSEFTTELIDGMWNAEVFCTCGLSLLTLPLNVLCCIPTQYVECRPQTMKRNWVYEVIARYNKYLFVPHGMQARYKEKQNDNRSAEGEGLRLVQLVVIECATPGQIKTQLSQPVVTEKNHLHHSEQRFFLQDNYPMNYFQSGGIIGSLPFWISPKVEHFLDESEINDPILAEKYAKANERFGSTMVSQGSNSGLTMER